jgi:hypothetical protein
LIALGACGFNLSTGSSIDANGPGDGSNTGSDADIDPDGPDIVDGPMPDAPVTPQWHTPNPLGFSNVDDPTLTGNMLDLWFEQGGDIYHASRLSIFSGFGMANKVNEISTTMAETTPEVSTNGLSMTLARSNGNNNDLYITTWDGNGWTTPIPLTDLNTPDHEQAATISDDRAMLAMTRNAPAGSADIYVSTRNSPSDPWSNPVVETELNSNVHDGSVFLSGNKLTVCFDSQRASLQNDIYCATRASATVPFDPPAPLTEVNSALSDQDPWLSPDGKVIVFWSDRDGTGKLYYAIHI